MSEPYTAQCCIAFSSVSYIFTASGYFGGLPLLEALSVSASSAPAPNGFCDSTSFCADRRST